MLDSRNATRVCSVDDCDGPVDARGLCTRHYTKLLRYGDPLWLRQSRKPNLLGQRFGCLVVTADGGGSKNWVCACDCGATTVTRTWNLTSGNALSCGDGEAHRRQPVVSYPSAHKRVLRTKGSPSSHTCVECGHPAQEWSYNHQDPDELVGANGPYESTYSLNPDFYEPRCIPCHRAFDARQCAACRRTA